MDNPIDLSLAFEETIPDPRQPHRVSAPTEGRNSILYPPSQSLQDTTKFFFVDNKAADIASYNVERDHSDFYTNIIHNPDVTPIEASTQNILLDKRSRWGGRLRTSIKTNVPSCTSFYNSNALRVKLMTVKDPPAFEWVDLEIPEGNYNVNEVIDLLNDAIWEHFLAGPRQNGVTYSDIGVKFDTRYFFLGRDPVTTLVTPGTYTYKGYHPDIILLPNCAVDFTVSRLSNMFGIRKKLPYQEGFILSYDNLAGGNIPALMDISKYPSKQTPLLVDENNISYNVEELPNGGGWQTSYRSWLVAYRQQGSWARENTLLTVSDPTGGLGQLYWSFPDAYKAPCTFKNNNSSYPPIVGMQMFPTVGRAVFSNSAVYGQLIEESTNTTMVFNRFPKNQILMQPPYLSATYINENLPTVFNHGVQPLQTDLAGVQRVTIHDDRRRPCPYVVKALADISPEILSSATLR